MLYYIVLYDAGVTGTRWSASLDDNSSAERLGIAAAATLLFLPSAVVIQVDGHDAIQGGIPRSIGNLPES